MAARWGAGQVPTVVMKGLMLLGIGRAGKGVSNEIFSGGAPFGNFAEVFEHLFHGQPTRYTQAEVLTRSTFCEKPKTCLVVCVHSDVLAFPLGGP